jgi:uncharacterized protein
LIRSFCAAALSLLPPVPTTAGAEPTPSRIQAGLLLNGAVLVADATGAVLWPALRLLVVADLHLEKGSSFARHGSFLPPYDTSATLDRLAALAESCRAEKILCLGDSFHDRDGPARLAGAERLRLRELTSRYDWIWVTGNHDPLPLSQLGGRSIEDELILGPLRFRHQARPHHPVAGEVSGHFHPTATIRLRTGRWTGRCFVLGSGRLILPAFGAFTGGLDVFAPAVRALFPDDLSVHVINRDQVVSVPASRIEPSAYTMRERRRLT